jgi:hypothetical protein
MGLRDVGTIDVVRKPSANDEQGLVRQLPGIAVRRKYLHPLDQATLTEVPRIARDIRGVVPKRVIIGLPASVTATMIFPHPTPATPMALSVIAGGMTVLALVMWYADHRRTVIAWNRTGLSWRSGRSSGKAPWTEVLHVFQKDLPHSVEAVVIICDEAIVTVACAAPLLVQPRNSRSAHELADGLCWAWQQAVVSRKGHRQPYTDPLPAVVPPRWTILQITAGWLASTTIVCTIAALVLLHHS